MDNCDSNNRKANNFRSGRIADNCKYNQNKSAQVTGDWTEIIENTSQEVNEPIVAVPLQNSFIYSSDPKKRDEKVTVPTHDIEEIKEEDINKMTDIQFLEKSSLLARNLKFQICKRYEENIDECIEWVTASLEWLRDVTLLLATRNSQPIIHPLNKKQSSIARRNSYKFCEYNYSCKFNYSHESKCYAQHYVYSLVHSDIIDILEHIKNTYPSEEMNLGEVKTSVNTITYVINHMFDELTKLQLYRADKYKNYEDRIYRFKSISNFRHRTKKNE